MGYFAADGAGLEFFFSYFHFPSSLFRIEYCQFMFVRVIDGHLIRYIVIFPVVIVIICILYSFQLNSIA